MDGTAGRIRSRSLRAPVRAPMGQPQSADRHAARKPPPTRTPVSEGGGEAGYPDASLSGVDGDPGDADGGGSGTDVRRVYGGLGTSAGRRCRHGVTTPDGSLPDTCRCSTAGPGHSASRSPPVGGNGRRLQAGNPRESNPSATKGLDRRACPGHTEAPLGFFAERCSRRPRVTAKSFPLGLRLSWQLDPCTRRGRTAHRAARGPPGGRPIGRSGNDLVVTRSGTAGIRGAATPRTHLQILGRCSCR